MSQNIILSETNIAANAFTENLDAMNASQFNPVQRSTKVSIYGVASVTQAVEYGLNIAGISNGKANAFLNAGLTLSTRDNLILQGVAFPGQKIALSRRELGGVATTDTEVLAVLEPVA